MKGTAQNTATTAVTTEPMAKQRQLVVVKLRAGSLFYLCQMSGNLILLSLSLSLCILIYFNNNFITFACV
jgi:hypothetical protein